MQIATQKAVVVKLFPGGYCKVSGDTLTESNPRTIGIYSFEIEKEEKATHIVVKVIGNVVHRITKAGCYQVHLGEEVSSENDPIAEILTALGETESVSVTLCQDLPAEANWRTPHFALIDSTGDDEKRCELYVRNDEFDHDELKELSQTLVTLFMGESQSIKRNDPWNFVQNFWGRNTMFKDRFQRDGMVETADLGMPSIFGGFKDTRTSQTFQINLINGKFAEGNPSVAARLYNRLGQSGVVLGKTVPDQEFQELKTKWLTAAVHLKEDEAHPKEIEFILYLWDKLNNASSNRPWSIGRFQKGSGYLYFLQYKREAVFMLDEDEDTVQRSPLSLLLESPKLLRWFYELAPKDLSFEVPTLWHFANNGCKEVGGHYFFGMEHIGDCADLSPVYLTRISEALGGREVLTLAGLQSGARVVGRRMTGNDFPIVVDRAASVKNPAILMVRHESDVSDPSYLFLRLSFPESDGKAEFEEVDNVVTRACALLAKHRVPEFNV